MAILPLSLARVSNYLRSNLATRTITRTQQSVTEVQNQLATGKRINSPSDDPGGSAIAMQLRKTLEQRQAYGQNLDYAASHLNEVDSSLSDLTDLLREAQEIASANAGTIVTAEQRASASTVIARLYEQAVSVGNRQFRGTYLFAGDRSTDAPFIPDLGGVRFVGSDRVLQNSFDENSILPFMTDGNEVFGALSSRVRGSVDLSPVLSADTRLTDLRGATGNGIRLGSITLSDGVTTQSIDLSGADTVGDILDKINAAGVGAITASIAADGNSIQLSAGAADSIAVSEVGAGITASDLGILSPTSPGAGLAIDGQNLGPIVTPLTKLGELRGGLGIDLAGLTITNGTRSATLDFASPPLSLTANSTVEDFLNSINNANVGVLARINDGQTGIDILNPVQGTQMRIGENGGTTASDLGIRSFSPLSPLAELNDGLGVHPVTGDDFQITRKDGSTFSVDLSSALTIQDVIDAINAADAGGGVVASFAAVGNGIQLDDSTGGAGSLSIAPLNYSPVAQELGILTSSAGTTLAGSDVNAVEAAGIFGHMAALLAGLQTSNTSAITSAAEKLQGDLDRVIRIRGQVGARVQDIESRQQRLEDQDVATKALLSNIEDTNYTEAISQFQTLQTALQANLQSNAQILNLSLLDFLS